MIDNKIITYTVKLLIWNSIVEVPVAVLKAIDSIGASLQEKQPGPKVIKLFLCSTQLSTKVILLINVKMPTIVCILTSISYM